MYLYKEEFIVSINGLLCSFLFGICTFRNKCGKRRAINVAARKSELIQVERTNRGRGRPKITLVVVKKDVN